MFLYLQSKNVPFWGGQAWFRDRPGGYAWSWVVLFSTGSTFLEGGSKRGWRMNIMSSINRENVGGVLMSHGNPISFNYLVGRNVESDSLPEAICRAALLIVNNSQWIADLESKF